MALRKDDPIYYKKKISDLIKQAKEEGLEVDVETFECYNSATYLRFKSPITKEQASVAMRSNNRSDDL